MNVERLTLSPAEVSEQTGLSLSSVKRLIGSGELPSALVGGRRLVRVTDLESFLAERVGGAA